MKRIIILLFMLCNTNVFSQTIYYVKPTGNDANSGTSWTTAFRTVQKALATIASGEIWVAAGTYYPDEGPYQTNDERSESFYLKNNVALYGGFAGYETNTTQSSSNQTLTIEVTDNVGRIVERRTGVSPNATIYLGSNYRPGLYLLKIIQGHVVQTLKLLKQG